ncbi:universal stress protein [Amaricoccus macauensis]|uniref:universal stress protein n=1 Tax=Amaricoccus macauensis TaxID=57001 RepID=UPI003C7B9C26
MYKNILVPIDPAHGEIADRTLTIAKKLVDDDGQVTALSVIEPLPSYISGYIREQTLGDRIKENQEAAMAALRAAMDRVGLSGKVILDEGTPSPEILRIAREIEADAIVLGSHRPDFRDYLIGSTAARVVRHAQCTVIVERSTPVPT